MVIGLLGKSILLDIQDEPFRLLASRAFSGLSRDSSASDLAYIVTSSGSGVEIERAGAVKLAFESRDRALTALDDDLVVQLQKLRPDLLFLHAGAVARNGRVTVLVGGRGAGKSTTVWALTHHGFSYLSDELAALDPATRRVHPYPRAISLKTVPPHPYAGSLQSGGAFDAVRIPINELPGPTVSGPLPLERIVFLNGARESGPSLTEVPAAQASVRLYAEALNPLAHSADGLDVALQISSAAPAFELTAGGLEETALLLAGEKLA